MPTTIITVRLYLLAIAALAVICSVALFVNAPSSAYKFLPSAIGSVTAASILTVVLTHIVLGSHSEPSAPRKQL